MNYWNQNKIPHKGWDLDDVVDVRENGEEEWETIYETCMMCGKEKIRFVHVVSHPEVEDQFRVGCVCAEKMTEDYVNPKQRERELHNRANRRTNWVKKNWKTSKTGNFYLNVNDTNIVIYRDKASNQFKVKIAETFGKQKFDTLQKAKIAAFNGFEYLKAKEDW
jgi:ribosomal protein S4E